MSEFEVFRRTHSPVVNTPAVTLTKRGQLSINDAAFTELGSPKAVELMYSRADRIVGIRAVDPSEPHAYVPRTRAGKNRGHGPYVVAGSAFLSYFGIEVEQTTRYRTTVQDGVLTIDLKEPGIPLASNENSPANRGNSKGRGS